MLNCYMAEALVQSEMRTRALVDPVYYRWMTEWMERQMERGRKKGRWDRKFCSLSPKTQGQGSHWGRFYKSLGLAALGLGTAHGTRGLDLWHRPTLRGVYIMTYICAGESLLLSE